LDVSISLVLIYTNAKNLVYGVLNIFPSHIFLLRFCQHENVRQEDTSLSDRRIEHHSPALARLLARAGNAKDGASRVNFSDAMIGAVGDKQASVFRYGDFLRRVELGLQGLSAVAAEALAPGPGDHSQTAPAVEFQHAAPPMSEMYRSPLSSSASPFG